MPCQLAIQIDAANATIGKDGKPCPFNWDNSLYAVAKEFETVINPALVASGMEGLPVHSDSDRTENYLGSVNTVPTSSEDWQYAGLVTVSVPNYSFINSRFFDILSQQLGIKVPQTFWLIGGDPPQAGDIS